MHSRPLAAIGVSDFITHIRLGSYTESSNNNYGDTN